MGLRAFSFLVLFFVGAAFATACGGERADAQPDTASREPTATATPEPTPTPWPILGRVLTRMEATCELGLTGAELNVRYAAQIEGEAEISRVRILVNNEVREDIAHLAERAYSRQTTIGTMPNRMVTVEMQVEARGAPPAPKTAHLVRCPRAPALPRT